MSLSDQAQQTLKIASCLRTPMSISLLVLISDDRKGVEDALASGILCQYRGRDRCCFVHNQFTLAARSLIAENQKLVFLSLARKLSNLLSTIDIDDAIFDITNLYYNAKELIEENERFEVVKLFKLAGEKALVSTAHNTALEYFKSSIEPLDKDSWNT